MRDIDDFGSPGEALAALEKEAFKGGEPKQGFICPRCGDVVALLLVPSYEDGTFGLGICGQCANDLASSGS